MERILRIKEVEHLTGLGKSTIYYFIERGEFPRPVRLGKKTVGWHERDIKEWILSRPPMRDH